MSYNETEMAYKNGYEKGYRDAQKYQNGCCDGCAARPVCYIYSATGGVPSCRHFLSSSRKAVWEEIRIDGTVCWQCSECDNVVEERTAYCSCCGAEMAVVI